MARTYELGRLRSAPALANLLRSRSAPDLYARETWRERADVLHPCPRDATRECGRVDRNVNQGKGAVAWRQILEEYASTEPGNVLAMWSKLGELRFPQGSDIVVGINKMKEDMTRYPKMAGENLSDSIKRGILLKALTNEAELHKHVATVHDSARTRRCWKG